MTATDQALSVRVTQRFDAPAERVYDAFLDPAQARKFLFATATGRIVRCELEPRVGGRFVIIDLRDGEEVAHVGEYLELERPRRIRFRLSVEKYATAGEVTLEIVSLPRGCELTLTHEMRAAKAATADGARDGWSDILEVAAELLVDEAPTCGIGVAQHAAIPARVGAMFEGLAETFALHRKMLVRDDPAARREDEVYRELAASWKEIAERISKTAATMAAQRALPMAPHDESAWGNDNLAAFEAFVHAQTQLLALLRVAAERDERMLAAMKKPG
jgi:uncharacterized protein YndB with AHSA1/START domain